MTKRDLIFAIWTAMMIVVIFFVLPTVFVLQIQILSLSAVVVADLMIPSFSRWLNKPLFDKTTKVE